ncbi:prepilin peptidase [Curvibacter sp. CHRR-16]|uniref:A24 family peptidase n=1 Tax=Curvibacter sp. CHRR-16 TaxID=2835872 RepID=UPI001BD9BB48|nr:prepilin peptidase [Curvibacter sp. CHRR-16]MBT0570738.1 prepilin peptidase [Curvibacter sp. CHRR-16]
MTADIFVPVVGVFLAWVMVSDLLYRRISNQVVVALLVLWMGGAICRFIYSADTALEWGVGRSALVAAAVLVVGFGLFYLRWVGAGDVKLMAVLCLWFGEKAMVFLLATSLVGGLLALALPLLRVVELYLAQAVFSASQMVSVIWPRWHITPPLALGAHTMRGIPYGVAIGLGGSFVLCVP